jgi:hypothetical protein
MVILKIMSSAQNLAFFGTRFRKIKVCGDILESGLVKEMCRIVDQKILAI